MGKQQFRRCLLLFTATSAELLMVAVLVYSIVFYSGSANMQINRVITREPACTHFPIPVEGTTMRIEKIVSYEGDFWEDQSGQQVMNVISLLFRNMSDDLIIHASIEVKTDHNVLIFFVEMLPPGAAVIVPEYNKTVYDEYEILHASGDALTIKEMQTTITVSECGMSKLVIKNSSNHAVHNLVLYHKTVMPDSGIFIGGIGYSTTIDCINPYDEICVEPLFYASGYSKVVYISYQN